jgi:Tfp pilus assembly protein PilV
MPRVWLTTKVTRSRQTGFSVVEVLLAIAVFGFLAAGLIGALVYGRVSTAGSGDRVRANYVADEGIEALRNIRSDGYTNLVDGTYGLVQSSNTWTLSGASDTNGIYTRSVTIASNGTSRKTVTSHVAWAGAQGSGQVDVVSQLTNWISTLPKFWASPSQYGGVDVTGSVAGYRVDTSGNYAYIVRNSATGPNFIVVNTSVPTAPTVVGTLTLAGVPTSIAVSGNYAYVSNTSDTTELQVVNITTPTAPTLSGSYNAAGAGNGLGVYAVGTTVYLVRAANGGSDEFVIINAATPTAPTRLGGYSSNISMYEVYVNGTTAYVVTGSDTLEMLVINITTPGTLTLGTSINLPGTVDATTIAGSGNVIIVGQGTAFYTIGSAAPLSPVISGTVTLPGTIYDVDYDATHNYGFAGTSYASGEFQVVNINNTASPAILSSVNMTGTINLTGVAYNASQDIVVGASSNTSQEAVVFGPN